VGNFFLEITQVALSATYQRENYLARLENDHPRKVDEIQQMKNQM